MHEAQLHQDNAFITLTYAPENLPEGGTLIKKDFQDFMKRLRKKYHGKKIKYYHCGEYGEESRRPHYHALLFGLRFVDQRPYRKALDGTVLFTSGTLSDLWPNGFATVGEVTFESAAYVARYVMKKITGKQAADHYTVVEPDTGEIFYLQPEYTSMSLKPAIAKDWYGKFATDVYPSDEVVIRGKVMKPPKYYDRLLEVNNLELHTAIKAERKAQAELHSADATKRRLLEREEVKIAQTRNLKRNVE